MDDQIDDIFHDIYGLEKHSLDNGKGGYLVVDTRDGGLDGWYAMLAMAEAARDNWSDELGHDDVVVCQVVLGHAPIGACFLANKRSRHG